MHKSLCVWLGLQKNNTVMSFFNTILIGVISYSNHCAITTEKAWYAFKFMTI